MAAAEETPGTHTERPSWLDPEQNPGEDGTPGPATFVGIDFAELERQHHPLYAIDSKTGAITLVPEQPKPVVIIVDDIVTAVPTAEENAERIRFAQAEWYRTSMFGRGGDW